MSTNLTAGAEPPAGLPQGQGQGREPSGPEPQPTHALVAAQPVRGLRRAYYIASSRTNRLLDRLPPCVWWHRQHLRRLHLPEYDVHLGRGATALDGLRIASIGDVHAGSYGRPRDWQRIVERVIAQQPDLVVLVGDLINSRATELSDLEPALRHLVAGQPPLGVHAVPGNHDVVWGGPRAEWVGVLERVGVQVMINRGTRLQHNGAPLWLAGVDDLQEGRVDMAAALRGHDPAEPVVLMAHHPDTFELSRPQGVDLTLSGHTHAGQIRLGPWVPIRHSDHGYHHGPFRRGDQHLHVTAGVGTTMLPIRLGTRAEVPILRLRRPPHPTD